jgi:2-C-methyl-D-erythritol 4-phosphate cytidylyltransferase
VSSIWAVVPAAGTGRRLGGETPKQYREIARIPLLEHTLRALLRSPDIRGIMVALDPSDRRADGIPSLTDVRVETTQGGAERSASVLAGLNALADRVTSDDWVLVHDAARPCLDYPSLCALIEHARGCGEGVILAEPVADTLKRVDGEGAITATVDRSALWRAQTPQLFPFHQLHRALNACLADGVSVTDEAMAVELAGGRVRVLPGPPSNIKVTLEADLAFAELLLLQQNREGS